MDDKSVGFVFPTTIVKSIHLGVYKKIQGTIFKGFEDRDRNRRILSFANLHIYSYKGNLIYSLFRTNILREAFKKQGHLQRNHILHVRAWGSARSGNG